MQFTDISLIRFLDRYNNSMVAHAADELKMICRELTIEDSDQDYVIDQLEEDLLSGNNMYPVRYVGANHSIGLKIRVLANLRLSMKAPNPADNSETEINRHWFSSHQTRLMEICSDDKISLYSYGGANYGKTINLYLWSKYTDRFNGLAIDGDKTAHQRSLNILLLQDDIKLVLSKTELDQVTNLNEIDVKGIDRRILKSNNKRFSDSLKAIGISKYRWFGVGGIFHPTTAG